VLRAFAITESTTATTTTTTTTDMEVMRMMANEPVKEKHTFNIGTSRWDSVDEENDVDIRDSDNG